MRRKPRLYDGTAMTNLDKKRLVEIFPRNGEPPDGGIGRDFGNNKLKPRTWKDETPSPPASTPLYVPHTLYTLQEHRGFIPSPLFLPDHSPLQTTPPSKPLPSPSIQLCNACSIWLTEGGTRGNSMSPTSLRISRSKDGQLLKLTLYFFFRATTSASLTTEPSILQV